MPAKLDDLDDTQRSADRRLRAAAVSFEPVDPGDATAQWTMGCYDAELEERFDGGFDAAEALGADAQSFRAPPG